MFCNTEDIQDLLPAEVDDDYISMDSVGEQPAGDVSLTKGFNVMARIYLCFMVQPYSLQKDEQSTDRRMESNPQCRCCIHGSPENEIRVFEDLFGRIQDVLSDLPSCLTPWQHGNDLDSIDDAPQWDSQLPITLAFTRDMRPSRYDSLGSMRANIHITQLWARYVIFERLVTLYEQNSKKVRLPPTLLLSEHELLCEKLLYLLSNISFRSLESNGVSLTFKIRQIAALFLQYETPSDNRAEESVHDGTYAFTLGVNPHETGQSKRKEATAQRAHLYISKFMHILTRLDAFTFQDTQQVLWNASPQVS